MAGYFSIVNNPSWRQFFSVIAFRFLSSWNLSRSTQILQINFVWKLFLLRLLFNTFSHNLTKFSPDLTSPSPIYCSWFRILEWVFGIASIRGLIGSFGLVWTSVSWMNRRNIKWITSSRFLVTTETSFDLQGTVKLFAVLYFAYFVLYCTTFLFSIINSVALFVGTPAVSPLST